MRKTRLPVAFSAEKVKEGPQRVFRTACHGQAGHSSHRISHLLQQIDRKVKCGSRSRHKVVLFFRIYTAAARNE